MKRWLVGAAALLLLLTAGEGTELGQLKPIGLLYVSVENGQVHLQSDLDDRGKGSTVREAISDLKASSSGIVFLSTAEVLLLSENARKLLPDLYEQIRPATRICLSRGKISPKKAAVYLKARGLKTTLGELRSGTARAMVLEVKEGRYRLGTGKEETEGNLDAGSSSGACSASGRGALLVHSGGSGAPEWSASEAGLQEVVPQS